MFEVNGNFTIIRFNVLYSEGIWSLGLSTGSVPVSFDKCTISLAAVNITGINRGVAPVLCQTSGPVTFSNSQIIAGTYYHHLYFRSPEVSFINCRLETSIALNLDANNGYDSVKFINTSIFTAGQLIRLDEGKNTQMVDEMYFFSRPESFLLPGGKVKSLDQRTFENIDTKYHAYPAKLDQYNSGYVVSVNSSAQTLTFTPTNPGLFTTGDIIYTTEPVNNTGDNYDAAPTVLGHVTANTGGVITLSYIPAGIVSGGTYPMFIIRMPRFVNRAFGTVTNGSVTITSLVKDTGGFEQGDRIRGYGIVPGTYILSISSTTITLSQAATATATLVELYDAKIKVSADDTTFKYVGGNYNYDLLEVIWFIGDELRNVTYGVESRGRYCIGTGKTLSGTPPIWHTGINSGGITVEEDPVFTAASTNIPRLNAANTFTQNQRATQWLSGQAYFYDDYSSTHIGNNVGGAYQLTYENYGLITYPGGTMYTSILDWTAPIQTASTLKSGSLAPGGNVQASSDGTLIVSNTLSSPTLTTPTSNGLSIIQQTADGVGLSIRNVGNTTNLRISTNASFGFMEIVTNNTRLDINSGTGAIYLMASNLHMPETSIDRASSTSPTGVGSQVNSKSIVFENNMWNGSSALLKYSGVVSVASSSVNELTRLSFQFGATSPSVLLNTERFAIWSNGKIQINTIDEYADNAAAVTGGLAVGMLYKTGDNLKIVHA
jgi:hypothetical protein